MLTKYRSKRTISGGRYREYRKKRLYEKAAASTLSKIGPVKKKTIRAFGGAKKERILSIDFANLVDPKSKSFSKVKIKTLVDSPANSNYVRRNIITKGSIIETEKGRARVTNSPGSEGSVNAVLIG